MIDLTMVYAVRQESTGLYLPDVRSNFTASTPETLTRSPGMPHGARLSTVYRYVSARRTAYVKGECATFMDSERDDFGGNVSYFRTEPQWTGPARDADDYAVVAFAMVPLGRSFKDGTAAVSLRPGYEARNPDSTSWRSITYDEYIALSPTSVEVRRVWIEEHNV